MYPSPIREYHSPKTVAEAVALYAELQGEVMFIAGGMSLMQAIKSRLTAPDCLIDLNHVEELAGINTGNETISIGAMTRYKDIAASRDKLSPYDTLCDAAAHVGDRQVRNRGTIGGSLCWNYIAACTPIATLAAAGELDVLRCSSGTVEKILIDDFLQGPMETALEEGDMLLRINFPKPLNAAGSGYKKWGIVSDALPVIGVAVYIELESENKCSKARFAVGGLSEGAKRSSQAETKLLNADLSQAQSINEAAKMAAEEIETVSDPWISSDYRTHLIERLGTEVINTSLTLARGRLS
jgi:aerobic carbon-monoxide dehydrogenase medium subunit